MSDDLLASYQVAHPHAELLLPVLPDAVQAFGALIGPEIEQCPLDDTERSSLTEVLRGPRSLWKSPLEFKSIGGWGGPHLPQLSVLVAPGDPPHTSEDGVSSRLDFARRDRDSFEYPSAYLLVCAVDFVRTYDLALLEGLRKRFKVNFAFEAAGGYTVFLVLWVKRW